MEAILNFLSFDLCVCVCSKDDSNIWGILKKLNLKNSVQEEYEILRPTGWLQRWD